MTLRVFQKIFYHISTRIAGDYDEPLLFLYPQANIRSKATLTLRASDFQPFFFMEIPLALRQNLNSSFLPLWERNSVISNTSGAVRKRPTRS